VGRDEGCGLREFDALAALVNWVEQGQAPHRIIASARAAGNAGGVSTEVPSDLCSEPHAAAVPASRVARYLGGDKDQAASFAR
jgi:hypothetical protein